MTNTNKKKSRTLTNPIVLKAIRNAYNRGYRTGKDAGEVYAMKQREEWKAAAAKELRALRIASGVDEWGEKLESEACGRVRGGEYPESFWK